MVPKEFVKKVYTAYVGKKGLFTNRINAEELIPQDSTSLQKALFLFYVIQLDYAMRSQILYMGARRLFGKIPEFFTPAYILSLPKRELRSLIEDYLHPRYINEAVKRYVTNSELLFEVYKGDPRMIFESVETAIDALEKVKEFRGFGPKIGNFLVRTMINVFEYKYPDIEEILPPVDVHDVRIAHLMGYLKSDEMSLTNIKTTKKLWSTACKKAGVSWLIFDKALWLLGSEGRPQNRKDVLSLIGT